MEIFIELLSMEFDKERENRATKEKDWGIFYDEIAMAYIHARARKSVFWLQGAEKFDR